MEAAAMLTRPLPEYMGLALACAFFHLPPILPLLPIELVKPLITPLAALIQNI
ncbi:hypothetical protein [Spongiactinospora rosea]|uniref:hypothetical protein n=1 Tax=Spongiactinospora rosea TaxID=2248750 RepID=UPI00131400B8|nr:hypothetical protein [Spongiactinospora rosea]